MVGLETSGMSSFVQTKESFQELMEIIRDRMMKKKFYFVCVHCGEAIGTFTVRNLPELTCKCESKLIGFVPDKDKVIAKKIAKLEKEDASINAVVVLNNFAEGVSLNIDDNLEMIEPYLKEFIKPID